MTLKQEQLLGKMLLIFEKLVRQNAAYGEAVPFSAIADPHSLSYAARDKMLKSGFIKRTIASKALGGVRPVFSATERGREWYAEAKQMHNKLLGRG